ALRSAADSNRNSGRHLTRSHLLCLWATDEVRMVFAVQELVAAVAKSTRIAPPDQLLPIAVSEICSCSFSTIERKDAEMNNAFKDRHLGMLVSPDIRALNIVPEYRFRHDEVIQPSFSNYSPVYRKRQIAVVARNTQIEHHERRYSVEDPCIRQRNSQSVGFTT